MLKALHVKSLVAYSSTDVGTGRCRLNMMKSTSIKKMGSVLRLKLLFGSSSAVVLCTVWPDNCGCLDSNSLCLDDSVVESLSGCSEISWSQVECEVTYLFISFHLFIVHQRLISFVFTTFKILNVSSPVVFSSIHVQPTERGGWERVRSGDLLGFPLVPNATIRNQIIVSKLR
jgi:hypothetical protein